MSNIPLSNIEELLERSVFHRIRIECVDKGYLPNINLFPNTPAGQVAWEAALALCVTNKGFAIEVFGTANAQQRQTKKIPRIVIVSQGFLPGALGADSTPYFHRAADGTYESRILPPQTVDYFFNVHLVANTIQQMRVLQSILALALPRRAYIRTYDNTTTIFLRNIGFFAQDRAAEGILERVYSYEIPDHWERDPAVVNTGIAPLAEFTLEQELNASTTDTHLWASNSTNITQFSFPVSIATTLDPVAKTVTVTIPDTEDPSTLVADFSLSTLLCKAYVGATLQVSGTTPNDFTLPVIYKVYAADTVTFTEWTVTVILVPVPTP